MKIKKLRKLMEGIVVMLNFAAISQNMIASKKENHWVGTWGCSPQLVETSNLPPEPGLSNNTLRQVVHVSIGGERLRLKFSNEYGNSQITMKSVHLALSKGGSSINSDTDNILTFNGKSSITIPTGQVAVSDTLDYNLSPLTDVAITIYFGDTPTSITGHPGSRTTSYIQSGDIAADSSMSKSVAVDHWYIVTGIDVLTDTRKRAIVTLGDSITDGRGSTTNGNNRWPDNIARRLQENPDTSNVAILNQGIGGNAVLSGGLGPTAIKRFNRDVLGQSGVSWLIILEGINDIGESSKKSVSTDLINAYNDFINKAHNKNILVYGIPILPFGGSQYYSKDYEVVRQTVNNWIRSSNKFDAVIDLDAAVRNPEDNTKLLGIYDSGDHLHLNVPGYKKMAEMIDLKLFTKVK